MADPVRIAFLGCGVITRVHSRHLAKLGRDVRVSYASRDAARAEDYCRRFGGTATFATSGLSAGSYAAWLLYNDGYSVLAGPVAFAVT